MHSLSSIFTSSSQSDDSEDDSDSPHVKWKSALHVCSFLKSPQDSFCEEKGYLEQRRCGILNCGLKELCRILFFSSLHTWVSLLPKVQIFSCMTHLSHWSHGDYTLSVLAMKTRAMQTYLKDASQHKGMRNEKLLFESTKLLTYFSPNSCSFFSTLKWKKQE